LTTSAEDVEEMAQCVSTKRSFTLYKRCR